MGPDVFYLAIIAVILAFMLFPFVITITYVACLESETLGEYAAVVFVGLILNTIWLYILNLIFETPSDAPSELAVFALILMVLTSVVGFIVRFWPWKSAS